MYQVITEKPNYRLVIDQYNNGSIFITEYGKYDNKWITEGSVSLTPDELKKIYDKVKL